MPSRRALAPFACRLVCALVLTSAAPLWASTSLLWFEAGRPASAAQEAIAILAAADEDGLDPLDYGAAALSRAVDSARNGPPPDEAAQAQLDAALTGALQHYLNDRQRGRIDPRQVHARFDLPRAGPLLGADFLRTAVAQGRLTEAVRQAAPQLPMYEGLRRALASYRLLKDHPAWSTPLPAPPGRKLEDGQTYAGLLPLAQRLEAVGDLPPGTPVPPTYMEPLVSALQAFQQRHGLTPDGILGQATLRQLNVTPASRARQIELTLERLRWTPYLRAPRMIVINVPEFRLHAYEVHNGQIDVKLSMKVIVGKALDTRTPLFSEDMRFIEFSPYWNVPYSIARKELVPRLQRSPGYFHKEGFEFVDAGGQVVATLSDAHLDAVMAGAWRIRQRPGPLNALGDIKFVFPNNESIFLHHTPTPKLFERDRRDFSHGCIRVEAPVPLARFVLQDQPDWTEERIQAAMVKGETSTLRLKAPLPVLIAYSTVVVNDQRVFFYPDLYGHAQVLDQALRRHTGTLKLPDLPAPEKAK